MSIDQRSTARSYSSRHSSKHSGGALPRQTPPPTALTPENTEQEFEPCAATGSFLLYAQRNTILVLHHDTLAIERRFELHREDVRWITVDNVSERGSGRLAVSYDTGNTAIVWDIFTGGEIARFSAYDTITIASFMRNGNIAFGNLQGSIILFEPATSEHISARTIFDPITSLAPAADCRSFAIGYLNGSILVATIHPAFTIQHTLTTSRAPSKITGLAWHGSSSKSKTDMLAAQTADGDLRVWSVPKVPGPEQPMVIRVLNRVDMPLRGPNWFSWSKNGRIVQHLDGETRAWDVRTKKVTFDIIPTIESITGIAGYGPTATLFTLGRGHTVQQYDINPNNSPMQVNNVQHVPANTPPTPPTTLEESKNPYSEINAFTGLAQARLTDNESSADEGAAMSPLEKIAREMESLDMMEMELRDKVGPLSPTASSRASSTSSRSSGRGHRQRKYLYDRPGSSKASTTSGYDGTEFSYGVSQHRGHESVSIRSSASVTSHKPKHSNLRNMTLRSPQTTEETTGMDLFPFVRQRLQDIDFRTPHYGNTARTADILRREMLSVVFGWNDDVESLIRDEMSRHRPGSASAVLLAKWLGDVEPNSMAAMVGSESMTSSDWMLLALSSIQANSQKKVGEAFVQRLLEKGDIHPAVAILIGMNEYNDAIEVFVSQNMWMEALLLCALYTPQDWGRQSYLLRKWGEIAVKSGKPELAVRIFSCGSIESSDAWFSPRAQDAGYTSAQQMLTSPNIGGMASPPLSPPSRSASGRLKAKNGSLKLITSFGNPMIAGDPTPLAAGVTPIAQSALSPGGDWQYRRRDNSEVRTATPGGFARARRLPSRSDIERAKADVAELTTPQTAARGVSTHRERRNQSTGREPGTVLRTKASILSADQHGNDMPSSPVQGGAARAREASRHRAQSRDRNAGQLALQIVETQYDDSVSGDASAINGPRTGASSRSTKHKASDSHISSIEEARAVARQERAESRKRTTSRTRGDSRSRATSRARDPSESRSRIRPPKKSPVSPVPMSPEEYSKAQHATTVATGEDEDFYRIASPVDSATGRSFAERQRLSDEGKLDARGRGDRVASLPHARSPSAPAPALNPDQIGQIKDADTESDGRRVRVRTTSNAREQEELQHRRAASRSRAQSSSRPSAAIDAAQEAADAVPALRPRLLTREQAARELEERRLSLARRPSAPSIPLPAELSRPSMLPRTNTDLGNSPTSFLPPMSRSATVDPDAMARYGKLTGTPTSASPPGIIGLPATPRAMRQPKHVAPVHDKDDTPPVPEIPESLSSLSGSMLSQVTSAVSQLSSDTTPTEADGLGPLLPSTVYKAPPSRSASVPLEKAAPTLSSSVYKPNASSARRLSKGHIRKISPPDLANVMMAPAITSIEGTLLGDSDQIIIISENAEAEPVVLPELQHLAGPPIPPPPPTMFSPNGSGTINIAIDGNESNVGSDLSSGLSQAPSQFPQPMERAITTSPTGHRRRGSLNSEGFTARMRGVADRMRSSSKSGRNKTPLQTHQPMPYESIMLPHERKESIGRVKSPYESVVSPGETLLPHRAKSPYEQAMSQNEIIPPPPPAPLPPPAGYDHTLNETSIPPSKPASVVNGYRNPKEIRANMPPDYTQAGAQGGFL